MRLKITGKNLELSPQMRDHIERKLGKLGRYLPKLIESEVEVSAEKTRSPKHHFVVQATLNSNGTLLRGEERAEDIFTAVDKLVDIMNRQIERYKGKRYKKGKGNLSIRGELSPEAAEEESKKLIKVKRFAIKPMEVNDAIEQMELLGHNFFLFRNADTGEINLLYLRNDGNYGLIEPEIE